VRLHGWYVAYVCMCAYCALLIFLAIESNEECAEEGEVFEYQEEEDQGLANQGKPSKLDAYLNPIHSICRMHKGLLKCMFSYSYSSCSNYVVGSSSTSQIVIILRDDLFKHLNLTLVVVAC
jgi:hypothetical protein